MCHDQESCYLDSSLPVFGSGSGSGGLPVEPEDGAGHGGDDQVGGPQDPVVPQRPPSGVPRPGSAMRSARPRTGRVCCRQVKLQMEIYKTITKRLFRSAYAL